MIKSPTKGLGKFTVPEEISLLYRPDFEFYVTGSHYFGCATEESDYDFLTQDSPEVIKYLEASGFTLMGADAELNAILSGDPPEYLASDARGIYQLGRIQVQAVFDLKATLMARDILSTFFAEEHKAMDKEERDQVWPAAVGLAQLVYKLSEKK